MPRFSSEPAYPSKLLIARCYSTIRARIRPNGFERILAHRIGCQRATASLSSRVASKQLCNYSEDRSECQHLGAKKFWISTRLAPRTSKLLRRREIHATQRCRASVPRLSPGSGKLQKSHRDFGTPRCPLARGILSLFVSPAIRHFCCLYRRSSIDDSLGKLTRLGSEILRGDIDRGNEETKSATTASYSAGNETTKTLPCPSAAWTACLSLHSS